MSRNNSNTRQNAQAEAQETTAPRSKKTFTFDAYQEAAAAKDPSSIDEFVTDEYNPNEWSCAWIRYNNLEKAQKTRYFDIVRRDTHGHLFKDAAFDPLTNQIGRGKEYLHPSMGGIPELTLCIRPKEAEIEEERQMSEASARRLEQSDKLKDIKERMGNVVGANVFGGVSMSHSHSGWLK